MKLLLAGGCIAVAFATTACGSGARSTPRTAPAQAPVETASECEAGQLAFERRDFATAAAAFDECIKANPTLAYSYYRAGLAYYEINRPDLMITRFETFVRLAPDAPERAQVESILSTARDRRSP
jgi:tetratricopeptide (TPR) repeat protein